MTSTESTKKQTDFTLHQVISTQLTREIGSSCIVITAQSKNYISYLLYDPIQHKFLALFSSLYKSKLNSQNLPEWVKWKHFSQTYISYPAQFHVKPSWAIPTNEKDMGYDALPLTNQRVEYGPKTDLDNGFRNCAYSTLIHYFQLVADNKGSAALVHFHTNHITILLYKNAELQFANSFPFLTKDDILYFLLSSLEKTKMDTKHTRLFYTGFLRDRTTLKQMIKRYLPNIQPFPIPETVTFDPCFAGLPLYYYTEPILSTLCEL